MVNKPVPHRQESTIRFEKYVILYGKQAQVKRVANDG